MEHINELKKMICSQCEIYKPCIQVKDGGVCVGCWPDYFNGLRDGRKTTPAAPDSEGQCKKFDVLAETIRKTDPFTV